MRKLTDFLKKNKAFEIGKSGFHYRADRINWTGQMFSILKSTPSLELAIEKEIEDGTFCNTSKAYQELYHELYQKADDIDTELKRKGRRVACFLNKIFIKKYIPQYLSYYVEKENLD